MIRSIYRASRELFLLSVLVLLAGCASKPTPSGFLDDYSNIEEVDFFKGIYVSKNPDKKITDYSKFKIDPVEIHFHVDAHGDDIKEEELRQLVEYYESHLKEIFSEKYQVVDQAGKDTLVLRTAITDVKPNKIYLNLHWSTTLLGPGLGGADFEAEFVDSVTGESILSVLDAKKGNRAKYIKGLSKWGHTRSVIKAWARTLVKLVDEDSKKK
ncbi:MAG: DUF3313 domain-containing protein [Candidatus Omnitrophota bacterium]